MSPLDWALLPLRKYADFSGRAPRREYWWFVLLEFVCYLAGILFDTSFGLNAVRGSAGVVTLLLMVALLIPALAVSARRLHDTGRSGWWQLIAAVPLVGGIILLVWLVTPGDNGSNEYGDDPYGSDVEAVFA